LINFNNSFNAALQKRLQLKLSWTWMLKFHKLVQQNCTSSMWTASVYLQVSDSFMNLSTRVLHYY